MSSSARATVLALLTAITLAACSAPTAPVPQASDAPSYNEDSTTTDSTAFGGYNTGHG